MQSRIKELEKIERIELPNEEKTIHFSFPQPKPSGRIVAEFHNVSKSYGEKFVFGGVNFIIERGDRIALVGVNGAGKSTLIKLLAGSEPLTSGEYRLGHNVEVDYFAQDQYKELDPNARMLDDLQGEAPRSTNTELRSLLGCFLFSEDDVFKRIGVLSGGERNRYALARMLLQPRISCCSTSPPITWTCAPRMCCWNRSKNTPERWSSSRTTAISSTNSRRAFSKWATAKSTFSRATTKTTCGARKARQIDLTLPTERSCRRQSPTPDPQSQSARSA